MSSEKSVDLLWVNAVFKDLLKVVHDGFGGASQFRCYLVGRSFLNHLVKSFGLKFDNLPMTESIKQVLASVTKLGLIKSFELSFDDPILEFKLENCVHQAVQAELAKSQVPTFVCPIINMCLALVEEKYNADTEVMSFSNEGSTCKVKAILFK